MFTSVQTGRLGRTSARLGGAALAAALVVGGAVVAPSTAWAADPLSPTSLYATTSTNRVLQMIDPVTGTTTATSLTVPGSGTVNQIGLSRDGDRVILTDGTTVHRYTASTDSWASVLRNTGPGATTTMGGVDPLTGYLFYGGQAAGSSFTFARYDPTTNSVLPGLVTVTAADAPGGNGDLVFDAMGNMYFVAGASGTGGQGQLYRANAADIAAGSATATPLGGRIAAPSVNSIAFGDDGYLYVYGNSTLFQISPVTGGTVSNRPLNLAVTDLGSRAVPFTAQLTATLPDGRYDGDDAFTVTLGGGGISTGNTGVTNGTGPAVVGPILVLPGETYTIGQQPSQSTNPNNYTTTWTCVDAATGNIVNEGTGSSGTFTIPASGVQGVSCSFTNSAVEVTDATDDRTVDNTLGQPVTVPVVTNDGGRDLDPESVRILDADGQPQTALVVEGQGTWTVDTTTGTITFTPEAGYLGNPTPVTYTLDDTRGNTTQATVSVAYTPVATPDAQRDRPQGLPVVVNVLGNDAGDLDPASVRVLDADDQPVTELVVEGEGTWTVNSTTGAITFTPQANFSGNPTPITYQASSPFGVTTSADVVVTFAPLATDDTSLGNEPGLPVVVDVLGNDLGTLDPASVSIVDGEGVLVTTLVVEGEGAWSVDAITGALIFAPEPGFSRTPTPVVYEVSDFSDNTTRAEVTVSFARGAAADESVNNVQGQPVVVNVLGNDSGDLDPAAVRIVGPDGLSTTLVVEGEGTWTVDPATGAITFTPEPGFSGNPSTVRYDVFDLQADVVVAYVPVAVADESADNAQGDAVVVDVLSNDLGALDRTSVRLLDPAGDAVTELVVDGQGTWSVDPTTGAVTFEADESFSGNPTPVAYVVTDERGNATQADVVVTFLPVAADDESLDNAQGRPVTVSVTANDLGALDPASVRIVDDAVEPATERVVEGEGTWSVNATTGAITFTPEAGFSGNPTPITYAVSDVLGNISEADVVVTFVPVAADDESRDNAQGAAVVVDVLANDLGDLDPTSVGIVDGDGDLVTELVVAGQGTWTVDGTTGVITFTPEAGFTGNPTPITYEVADVLGNVTQAQVTVTYVPLDEPTVVTSPVPTPPVGVVTEPTTGSLPITGAAVLGVVGASLGLTAVGAAFVLLRRRLQQA